jgi:Ribbon-helix-helix protein, copG family.
VPIDTGTQSVYNPKQKGGDIVSPREDGFRVRLDKKEREKLEEEAAKAGFRNLSDFVRYMTIGEGRTIQEDLKTIIEKLNKK